MLIVQTSMYVAHTNVVMIFAIQIALVSNSNNHDAIQIANCIHIPKLYTTKLGQVE